MLRTFLACDVSVSYFLAHVACVALDGNPAIISIHRELGRARLNHVTNEPWHGRQYVYGHASLVKCHEWCVAIKWAAGHVTLIVPKGRLVDLRLLGYLEYHRNTAHRTAVDRNLQIYNIDLSVQLTLPITNISNVLVVKFLNDAFSWNNYTAYWWCTTLSEPLARPSKNKDQTNFAICGIAVARPVGIRQVAVNNKEAL